MSVAAQNAAASWRIRRRNRSAIFTLNCTPWSPGLVCSPGAVCQSNGLAWTTAEAGQSRAVDMFLNFPVMDAQHCHEAYAPSVALECRP
jgi:hypothetical protein